MELTPEEIRSRELMILEYFDANRNDWHSIGEMRASMPVNNKLSEEQSKYIIYKIWDTKINIDGILIENQSQKYMIQSSGAYRLFELREYDASKQLAKQQQKATVNAAISTRNAMWVTVGVTAITILCSIIDSKDTKMTRQQLSRQDTLLLSLKNTQLQTTIVVDSLKAQVQVLKTEMNEKKK